MIPTTIGAATPCQYTVPRPDFPLLLTLNASCGFPLHCAVGAGDCRFVECLWLPEFWEWKIPGDHV